MTPPPRKTDWDGLVLGLIIIGLLFAMLSAGCTSPTSTNMDGCDLLFVNGSGDTIRIADFSSPRNGLLYYDWWLECEGAE